MGAGWNFNGYEAFEIMLIYAKIWSLGSLGLSIAITQSCSVFTTFASFCGSQEYHDNIGDLDGPEEKERAQAKIQKFISAFWFL